MRAHIAKLITYMYTSKYSHAHHCTSCVIICVQPPSFYMPLRLTDPSLKLHLFTDKFSMVNPYFVPKTLTQKHQHSIIHDSSHPFSTPPMKKRETAWESSSILHAPPMKRCETAWFESWRPSWILPPQAPSDLGPDGPWGDAASWRVAPPQLVKLGENWGNYM